MGLSRRNESLAIFVCGCPCGRVMEISGRQSSLSVKCTTFVMPYVLLNVLSILWTIQFVSVQMYRYSGWPPSVQVENVTTTLAFFFPLSLRIVHWPGRRYITDCCPRWDLSVTLTTRGLAGVWACCYDN